MNCYAPCVHCFETQIQIVVVRSDGAYCDLAHGNQGSIRCRAKPYAVGFSFRLNEAEIFFRNEVSVNVDYAGRVV